MTDLSARPEVDQRLDLANLNRTEFVNAMAHLYRGELSEATAWRTRIDTTSNWAVVMSVTTLSFVFADQSNERHLLIPIVTLFCTFLLFMEARRYRFYDIWRSRARMIEINFYRPILEGTPPVMPGWAATLGYDLGWPRFHMSWWEAAGRRLRRNYQWIYMILLASWLILLTSYPAPSTSPAEIAARAAIGPIPGVVVMASMLLFYGALLVLGLYSYWFSRVKKTLPAGHPGRLRATPHVND